jgi:pimeloyl-ACP methyl ester carboxylesterase
MDARCLIALALGLLALGGGCRSAAGRFLDLATDRGLRAEIVSGQSFRHLVLSPGRRGGRTLHVYLDGDGVPWLGGYPATDPTPRDPLVLDLLALDPGAAVYLGRPCYHGLAGEPGCAPPLWTSARYSEEVVASMAAASRRVLAARGAERIVWLGYSGGGVLAMLLAARVPETTGVITVAANLDVQAWTAQQRSSPLTGSLDPARQPSLPARVYQRHYAGGRDRTVPVEVTGTAGVVVIPEYDHRCCWTALWPSVLADLERADSGRRD